MKNIEIKRVNKLIDELKNGNDDAFNEICEIFKPLILNISNEFGYGENEIYLIYEELWKACKYFKTDRIYLWIYTLIKRELVRHIRETEKINIPNINVYTILKIKAFIKKYMELYNEEPTLVEISASLNIDEEIVKNLLFRTEISMYSNDNEERKLIYNSSLNKSTFDEEFCDQSYYKYLYDRILNLDTINNEYLKIIRLIASGNNMSDIGRMNNCTSENIRQKLEKARLIICTSSVGHSYNNPEYVKKHR